jgi:hypothetical protein
MQQRTPSRLRGVSRGSESMRISNPVLTLDDHDTATGTGMTHRYSIGHNRLCSRYAVR